MSTMAEKTRHPSGAAEALDERDQVLAEVELAKRRVIDAGLEVLRARAAEGHPFSANDVRSALRAVGVEKAATGALFNAAIKARIIRKIGWETSTDIGTHGKALSQYIGTGLAEETNGCAAPDCTKPRERQYRHCRMHVDRLQRFGSLDLPEREFGSMMLDDVELRPIPGRPDYAAGSDGHIYSVGRRWRTGRPRRLAECPNAHTGYMAVTIREDGKARVVPVHRLITSAWLGDIPDGLIRRHLDGNKANNRPDNLAYGTYQENSDDAARHGTIARGERQHKATVSDEDVERALAELADGAPLGRVAARYGVCRETVARWRDGVFRDRRADGSYITVPIVRDTGGRFTNATDASDAPALFDVDAIR